MGYSEFNDIEDMVFNRSFRNWVLYKSPEEAVFWENWVLQHPEKLKLVQHSKAIIYALQINFKGLTEADINAEIKRILQKTKEQYGPVEDNTPPWKRFSRMPARSFFLAAACILFLVLPALFYYRSAIVPKTVAGRQWLTNEAKNNMVELANTTDTTQLITLPDGSRVCLEKNSRLRYVQHFSNINREVYLTGEAFFDIKRNPAKPFLVFTSNIITKVLGTSFRVKAYASDKKAEVIVKTGKVSVFKTADFNMAYAKGAELGGIVVTPNQAVSYDRENNGFNKTIAEKPLLTGEVHKLVFRFDATPVGRVFQTMQEAYSIPILYDEEIMSSCSLSANLGNESFYEKLNIICRAINASYEMMDGNIVITSNGCK